MKMPFNWDHWIVRGLLLGAISCLLCILFYAPDVDLVKEKPTSATAASSLPSGIPAQAFLGDRDSLAAARQLLFAEHTKAIDEIKLRIEEEDGWYRYKFVLVGGVLAAFLTYIVAPFRGKDSNGKADERLENFFVSNAAGLVLALACVIAITIDIHIRNGVNVVSQLGLWIRNDVEQTLLNSTRDNLTTPLLPGFAGWETFLRERGKLHADPVYGLTFWPNLHFLTWVVYIIYITVFQSICRYSQKLHNSTMAGFALVHVSLAVFAWSAHSLPSAYKWHIFPSEKFGWMSGAWLPPLCFLVPWLLIVLANCRYLYLLKKGLH